MTRFVLKGKDLENFRDRVRSISDSELRRNTLSTLILSADLSEEIFKQLREFDEFDKMMVSINQYLTFELIEKFPEFFDREVFMKKSKNIKLLLDKRFREKFNISDQEIREKLNTIKKIPDDEILNELDLDESISVIAPIVSKITYKENSLNNGKIEKIKEKFGDAFYTREIIACGKFNPSGETVINMFKNEKLTPELLIISVKATINYPAALKEILNIAEERVLNKEFSPEPVPNVISELVLTSLKIGDAVKLIHILYTMNKSPLLVSSATFLNFISLRNLSEDHVLYLEEEFKAFLSYEQRVLYARKRGFNNVLMALALADSEEWES